MTADVAIKRNTLRISLVAIASVFVFEFIGGVTTNSLALLTDSAHALLDAVVTGVLIIAATLALKPRDIDHTYGHGKIETIGGFIGGTALFVVSIFFIYEAVDRILAPPGSAIVVNPTGLGFAAVFYTLAVDGFRIGILRRAIKKTAATIVKADLYHSFADLASTAVALASLWLVTIGIPQADSVAAIMLGGLLAYLSSRFVHQNAAELTDVISPKLVASVRQAAGNTEGVLQCKDVKMRRVGREIFVDVTVTLHSDMSFENAHAASGKVEDNITKILGDVGLYVSPSDITVHFEPIIGGDLHPEAIVERSAAGVSGVRGVHNVLVSKIEGTNLMAVSLHVQVRRSASLVEAHNIANAVEDAIRIHMKGAESVTVHLEPLMPHTDGMLPISDERIHESVRKIVLSASDVKDVTRVAAYSTDERTLIIDVGCVFRDDGKAMTIEQIHDRVSEMEKQIRVRYPGSIVTIHAEPG